MSQFRIKTYPLGIFETNCYLLYLEDKKKAVVIDPPDEWEKIKTWCESLQVTPEAILLTHGHFDHIYGVKELASAYSIPVYAGEKEEKLLDTPEMNLSVKYGRYIQLKPDHFLHHEQVLNLAGMKIEVIETPGHTAGSVCYLVKEEDVLISGDCLFLESLGRTDLPTSNTRAIIDSILNRLFPLPQDTMVYPGHGDPTTIGHETRYNPVVRYRGRI